MKPELGKVNWSEHWWFWWMPERIQEKLLARRYWYVQRPRTADVERWKQHVGLGRVPH